MLEFELPSKLLEKAVKEISKLPGIGHKTGLRLILHLLTEKKVEALKLGDSLNKLINNIHYCKNCHNITEDELCSICSNQNRNKEIICIVEDIRDLLSIEKTQQYNGIYHVLGGIIMPARGIQPTDLSIPLLIERVKTNSISEIILALPTTMEGETTNYYLHKHLSCYVNKITTLARGIAMGDELQYADEITLGRSLIERIEYNHN